MDDSWVQNLTPSEVESLAKTNEWLNADASRFKKAMSITRKPIEFAYSKVPQSLRDSISDAILSVLTSVREGTTNFSAIEAVIERLENENGRFEGREDFFEIGVEKLDVVALEMVRKCKNACTAEGAVVGMAGLPGIVVDVPALYGLLFRMIAQVSAVYGYPVDPEEEKIHMMKILDIGHRLEKESKKEGIEEISELQSNILHNKAVVEVQRFAVQKGLQTLARHLGVALTQRKLAQSVVLVGGAIGAGVNRNLASEVGEAAFHIYRRRHLMELSFLRSKGMFQVAQPPKMTETKGTEPSATKPTVTKSPPSQPSEGQVMPGTSKIQLDKNTVNILLKEFASKDGAEVLYENGHIVVNKDGLKLTVTELPLKSTKLQLDGKSGKVNLELSDFKLEESQISLDLSIDLK